MVRLGDVPHGDLRRIWTRRVTTVSLGGFLAIACLFAGAGSAEADCDLPEGVEEASVLPSLDELGDRPLVSADGVSVGASYIGEYFGTVSGGIDRTWAYDGVLDVYMDADMQKLGLWDGLCFHANALQIHGDGITAKGTGSLAPVSSAEAVPATRLFELWFEQHLMEDRLAIRFGQIAADAEFAISEGGSHFLNGTWGWPTITASDMADGGPAYPLATPGVRVLAAPTNNIDVLVGLFNGLSADPCAIGDPQRCNDHGLDFPLGDDPLLMAEIAYRYDLTDRLPGQVKFGGWNHFGDFEDLRFDSGGNLIAVTGLSGSPIDGNYGFYGIVDQLIWEKPGSDGKGIGIFGRFMWAPEDRNLVDAYTDMGITFTGMIPGRPDDALAIGFAYTNISDNVSAADVDSGLIVAESYESLVEVAYTFQVTDNWMVQPDFQYIWQPGGNVPNDAGTAAVEDVAVIGARSTWDF
ncbi:carbohydrate porin [Methyloligella sp. 2.7D]|uniref:carbohydrate porin n=1 Tax=unclassified Methyloligella TaxID=2625955 RepID=UPI00157CBE6B|nr:carbohydrate porin [Methyloligella sp. GL2]QKP78596.1 carbohydrate porin [Methyloligella sp. GL2]